MADQKADCPICGKPADGRFKPFCSKRCGDVDLGRWLKGGYAIPGARVDPASASNPSEKDPEED